MAALPRYNLPELAANEIRLITIQPSEDAEAPVRCSMDHFDIGGGFAKAEYPARSRRGQQEVSDNNNSPQRRDRSLSDGWVFVGHPDNATAALKLPEFRYVWGDYMALSYTWGDPTITRDIIVNGVTMQVTENLEAALRILRSKVYVKAGWKMWIDALCIHQKDIIERATQVKRMREIYTKSVTPIVWLGATSPDSEQAIELIRRLAAESEQLCSSSLSGILKKDPKAYGEGSWRALHDFALRRFWSRAWVLQEISLGKEDMPVLCGEQTLSWKDIHNVFELLNRSDEIINRYMRNELADVGRALDAKIYETLGVVEEIEVLKEMVKDENSNNLFRVMSLSRLVAVTDPRDKVYGLLALLGREITRQIRPDYTATVEKVYTDFAELTINVTHSLEIIRHVGVVGPLSLASWVPDWMSPRLLGSLGDTPHKASGDTTAQVSFPQPGLLSCRGFIVDTFDGMGCVWKDDDGHGWPNSTVIQSSATANAYRDRNGMREALWRSLVANRNVQVETLLDDYGSLLDVPALHSAQGHLPNENLEILASSHLVQYCMGFYAGNTDFLIAGKPLHHYFTANPDFAAIDTSVLRNALIARDRVNLSRRLFTTTKGYVGMTRQDTRSTDLICVLFGCSMPIVLRKASGAGYTLVGECYVHGLMDGEGLDMARQGDVEVMEFTIQ